jgi:hypothetical protein
VGIEVGPLGGRYHSELPTPAIKGRLGKFGLFTAQGIHGVRELEDVEDFIQPLVDAAADVAEARCERSCGYGILLSVISFFALANAKSNDV